MTLYIFLSKSSKLSFYIFFFVLSFGVFILTLKGWYMNNSNAVSSQFINSETTFPAAIRAWEGFLNDQNKSVYTIRAFKGDIRLFASYFAPDKTVGSVSTKDISNFLVWMNNERPVPCSPKTNSRRITSIKSFFKWLKTFGAIEEDPAAAIAQQAVSSPLPEILTEEECKRVLAAADAYRTKKKPDSRNSLLFRLLLSTGIKKSETLGISKNHIVRDDPENPVLYVRYPNTTKRAKERKIDLPASILPVFDEYLEQYNPSDKIFPWSPRRLEYLLEDIGRDAELTKHLSFAMCRWTCFVKDYTENVPMEIIRGKMGVSQVQWREIYNKLKILSVVYKGETKE